MKLIPETGHHEYTIGEGVQHTKDKFGRPTADVGTVRFQSPKKMHFDGGEQDWVHVYSNFEDKDKLKRMGARFDGNSKGWYIPVKDIPNVANAFAHATITSQAAKAYEEALAHSPEMPAKQQTTIVSKDTTGPVTFDSKYDPAWNGEMPQDMKHVNLYEHQKAGVEFLLHNKKAVLGYAVGLGKTPTAITAANIAIDEGKVKRFAVVAPSSVKYQWKSEVEKFSGRKAVVLDNSTPKRLAQAFEEAKNADFVIVNYEMLRNPEYAEKIKELAGDAVIADEGHKIKNETQQTKAWKETFSDAKYRWLLTATPFPNGQPKETHTMLSHVAADKVGSWSKFAKEHAVMQTLNTPRGKIMKPVALKNQAELREKMKDAVMLRHHNSPDVNSSLPSARHVTHALDMTKEQAKIYNAMSSDLMNELEGMDDMQYRENAANILAKMKRLEQIAVDPDQLDPEHADMKKLYPKEQWAVDATIDHLENPDNRGMVIFSDTKLPLEKVKHGLISEGLTQSQIGVISGDVSPEKRTQIARLFGEGKIKVVLATSAGEEGVNLQHGGHTMIHLDTPWVPKSITQREGRILRTGQPSSHTTFYSPTTRGTVEETKRGKLASKVNDIEKLLGEGAAGSVADNVAASAKAWSKEDLLEMLGALPKGRVVKSLRDKKQWSEVKREKKDKYSSKEIFADPKHDSYPLTKYGKPSRERTLAAWRYINTRRDGDEYSKAERNRIKLRIRKFAKRHFNLDLKDADMNKSLCVLFKIG
ncbi:SNF2-related protein [Alicyclobacillus tolerans]|uniref:SNF2-related protein n=1 Tax=Alicyclobacillus tolerans TaxID=90970 RepID=UPI003B7965A7